MKVEVIMPQMGESIAEATILKWLKKPGEAVSQDETILEISTDKVDSEIPAPAGGVLYDVFFDAGETVAVKTPVAVIETEHNGAAPRPEEPADEAKPTAAQPAEMAPPAWSTPPETASAVPARGGMGRYFSPLVKSLAAKYGITPTELETIPGTGQGGRLTKPDLLNYVQHRRRGTPVPAAPAVLSSAAGFSAPAPAVLPAAAGPRYELSMEESTAVPMDHMRKLIAEHMLRSLQTSAHVQSVHEVDMSKVARWRAEYAEEFQVREGFKLSYTPFFLEAAAKSLLEFPYLNSTVSGEMIVLRRHVNLGVAVALDGNGLLVPVIGKAEEKNLVGLARSLQDLSHRARSKALNPEEVNGGTFTVTNAGGFGTLLGTPIINQPQVAILCIGQVQKRPVVIDDMIGIREMCYLTLSYDHRIIDGMMAGHFLSFLGRYLEQWDPARPLY